MVNFISRSSVSVVLGALLVASPIAAAQDNGHVASQKVVLADLDLNSAAGQRGADLRIARAVTAVCPDRFERDLRRQMTARSCQKVARSSAAEGLAAYRSAQ